MKIRQGFVSNSSSSSFVVHEADLQEMEDFRIKVYKIKDLLSVMETVKKCIDEIESNMPFFMWQELSWFTPQYYKEIVELHKRYPECYITEEYDRDQAYRNNWSYETFETDL